MKRFDPSRFAWLILLIAGAGCYLLLLHALQVTGNDNYFPSLLLLGSVVVPASVLVFAASSGRHVEVSSAVILVVASAGGVIGTLAAGLLEFDVLKRLGTTSMIGVALIEETAKLIIPIGVLLVFRDQDRHAGVIIGVASGMGFATLETMGYGFQEMLRTGSVREVDQTLLLRGLVSPACHVAWSGVTAAALWLWATSARRGRPALVLAATFILAVALHALWDGTELIAVHLTIGVLSLAALLWVIHWSSATSGDGRSALARPV